MLDLTKFTQLQLRALEMVHDDLGIYATPDLQRQGINVLSERKDSAALEECLRRKTDVGDVMDKWIQALRESTKVNEISVVNSPTSKLNAIHYILEFCPRHPVLMCDIPIIPQKGKPFNVTDYVIGKAALVSRFTSQSIQELLPPSSAIDIGLYVKWIIIEPAAIKTLREALCFSENMPTLKFEYIPMNPNPQMPQTTKASAAILDAEKEFTIDEDF